MAGGYHIRQDRGLHGDRDHALSTADVVHHADCIEKPDHTHQ